MTKNEFKEWEQKEALTTIKSLLKGTNKRVIASVKKVSQSGMSRTISFHIYNKGHLYCLNYSISKLVDLPLTDQGVRVSGCGMDMIFHIITCINYKAMELDNYKGHVKRYDNYIVSGSYDYI